VFKLPLKVNHLDISLVTSLDRAVSVASLWDLEAEPEKINEDMRRGLRGGNWHGRIVNRHFINRFVEVSSVGIACIRAN
jgi:hypothetical protein